MILVGIEGQQYGIKSELKDLTILDAIEVHKSVKNAPSNLQALYNATTQEALDAVEITDEDLYKHFPKWFGEAIELCSDIPKEVIGRIRSKDRIDIFKGYIEPIVADIIHLPEGINPITEFDWYEVVDGRATDKKITYKLPKSKDVLGEERIGAYMSALEFSESSDLEYFSKGLEGGRYEFAANIIAILCRPEGEVYDEDTSLARAEVFKGLPLDIVHGVFFSLIDSIRIYSLDMMRYLVEDSGEATSVNQLLYQNWGGTVRYLA